MKRMHAVALSIVALSLLACSEDPIEPVVECPTFSELNLTTTRIAVSELHGPIRLSTLDGTSERVIITGDVNAQDWSPARNRLVYVDERPLGEYALSVTDTLGTAVQLPVPLRSTWPVWSKDNWIYFFTQNNDPPQIRRIRQDGTNMSASFVTGRFPAPAPDGVRFAYALNDGIYVFDMAASTSRLVTSAAFPFALRWSPDGEYIAYIADAMTTVVRPDGTSKKTVGPGGPSTVGAISWSPDACWILTGSYGNTLQVINPRDGTFRDLDAAGLYVSWKP